ncbi:hypothetical protein [Kitasatospora sp. NPDC047058]|uniref:hypothetical protein n=1 Tax=Kitasatospora sp. NPDC047058 TaxID=3155620 RepID=UPI0033C825E4
MTLRKKLSAAALAAITTGTLVLGPASGALASDAGHHSQTKVEHTVRHSAPRAIDPAAIEAALRAVILANPQVIGSPLCPAIHTVDDVGDCLHRLQALLPDLQALLGQRVNRGTLLLDLFAPVIACAVAGNDPELCVLALPQGPVTTG